MFRSLLIVGLVVGLLLPAQVGAAELGCEQRSADGATQVLCQKSGRIRPDTVRTFTTTLPADVNRVDLSASISRKRGSRKRGPAIAVRIVTIGDASAERRRGRRLAVSAEVAGDQVTIVLESTNPKPRRFHIHVAAAS